MTTTPTPFECWVALRDQLARTRRSLNISQDTVADAAGISSRTTIGRIERGEALPGVDTFVAHARALGLEPALVEPALVRFLDLPVEDISAIVRAAAIAVDDGLVLPTDIRRRAHTALGRLQPRRREAA
jgi:transcriptional regulator with XRE-family HTH domain